ncbi:hypothetical protein LOK74_21630 [Brevibacillus humidisoli]|uniref:hypothetical protein n=1 Tax=Brevibacillus humidisoli TaxID=2895522 RepID=UPI001E64E2B3|nr:hypothetical protein [Brevibacillus humidisoli]UFJ40588.1 hypothetical protein LOK74_21630 [Brevibacillus humidisoli]
MRKDVQKFITHFRQLEEKTFQMTDEEERRWHHLKERLAAAPSEPAAADHHQMPRTIAVASLYSQAGASFVSSNAALLFAERQIKTTLCENPTKTSYFYFSFDSERRGSSVESDHHGTGRDTRLIHLLGGMLRVWVTLPTAVSRQVTQSDVVNWFLSCRRESPLLIIDLSSHWREEVAGWIADWSDELWLVFDSDLPRLTRQLITEPFPVIWKSNRKKIRLIANKWNPTLGRSSVLKKVEGTLSLWGEGIVPTGASAHLPAFDGAEVSAAQIKGKLLLEMFAEHAKWFEPLVNCPANIDHA